MGISFYFYLYNLYCVNMPKVIITGTPGSGKSTIIAKLSSAYKIINIGTEMMKYINDKSITRDQIRSKLTYQEIEEARKKVCETVSKTKGPLIVDTHTSIKSGKKFIPGFSAQDFGLLKNIKAIIYIDALPVDILLRRIGDRTRAREDETAEEIEEHRTVNISLASYYAVQLGSPLYIIKNKQERLDECRKEVERAISEALLG